MTGVIVSKDCQKKTAQTIAIDERPTPAIGPDAMSEIAARRASSIFNGPPAPARPAGRGPQTLRLGVHDEGINAA